MTESTALLSLASGEYPSWLIRYVQWDYLFYVLSCWGWKSSLRMWNPMYDMSLCKGMSAISVYGDSLTLPQWSAWVQSKAYIIVLSLLLKLVPRYSNLASPPLGLHTGLVMDETIPICEQYLVWGCQRDFSQVKPDRLDHVSHLKMSCGSVRLWYGRRLAGLKADDLWNQMWGWSKSRAWHWLTCILDNPSLKGLPQKGLNRIWDISNSCCPKVNSSASFTSRFVAAMALMLAS